MRTTDQMIMAKIEVMSSLTGMYYRYERNGSWYNLYSDNSLTIASDSRSEFFSCLEAIVNHLWTMDRLHKIAKKG